MTPCPNRISQNKYFAKRRAYRLNRKHRSGKYKAFRCKVCNRWHVGTNSKALEAMSTS